MVSSLTKIEIIKISLEMSAYFSAALCTSEHL